MMFSVLVKNITRKAFVAIEYFGDRKSLCLLLAAVLLVLVLWPIIWWFAEETSKSPLPPPPPLDHYKRNRSLHHYLTQIQVLIEPSSPCGSLEEVPMIILVSSSPPRFEHRQAVRGTWAKQQPTYFVLGLYGDDIDERLVDTYIEAKQYSDLIVFDFHDHYQNLTLKTALMMKWTLHHCPQVRFLFKTDDDILVNPWTLRKILKENADAQLIGYSMNNSYVQRDQHMKWYIPRWLLSEDKVSEVLIGCGYFVRGDYLEKILKAAYQVPMVNLEDVYFTYLVAHKHLGLTLTHDRRMCEYKPRLHLPCAYWHLAFSHSFSPEEMVTAWSKIESLVDGDNNTDVCWFFNLFLN